MYQLNVCIQCNKTIEQGDVIYRICDSSHCSHKCMVKRFNYIKNIDPGFNFPGSWNNLTNMKYFDFLNTTIEPSSSPLKKKRSYNSINIEFTDCEQQDYISDQYKLQKQHILSEEEKIELNNNLYYIKLLSIVVTGGIYLSRSFIFL
jgi:hypothetical protein